MLTLGISRRDYERLPTDTKLKAISMLEGIKTELRRRGFSLRFLGHNGRWENLTPPVFVAFPEVYYERLIEGSRLVRLRPREEMLEQISELYRLVKQTTQLEDRDLEYWFKKI
jgi:hypothetical protein